MDIIFKIYAFFATIPFIPFFIIYYVSLLLNKSKKESINIAFYISCVFFISAVAGQINNIFDIKNSYLLILLLVVLILVGLFFLQKNIKGKINVNRLFTSMLKLSVLLLSVIYVIFLTIQIIVI